MLESLHFLLLINKFCTITNSYIPPIKINSAVPVAEFQKMWSMCSTYQFHFYELLRVTFIKAPLCMGSLFRWSWYIIFQERVFRDIFINPSRISRLSIIRLKMPYYALFRLNSFFIKTEWYPEVYVLRRDGQPCVCLPNLIKTRTSTGLRTAKQRENSI